MKKYLIAIITMCVTVNAFGQSDEGVDLQGKIIELEARIIELEEILDKAEFKRIEVKNEGSDASIVIGVEGQFPFIKIFDSDGNAAIEIGISEWLIDSLITIYGQSRNAYLWNGGYIPSEMEWEILKMTASENNESFLSTKLNKQGFDAAIIYNDKDKKHEISVFIDTITQPIWNVYLGDGRFSVSDREVRAAYNEAAIFIRDNIIGKRFNDIIGEDYNIVIYFTNRGSSIGVWTNGVMKLSGE